MRSTDELIEEALALPPEDRERLLACLMASLPVDYEAIERAWVKEAIRRRDELFAGKTKGIPLEEVLGRARQRHRK